MLKNGQAVKTESGVSIEVIKPIKAGGQGTAYLVKNRDDRLRYVLKVFDNRFRNRDTEKRIQFLIELGKSLVCPALTLPVDYIDSSDGLGHVSPYIEGQELENYLENPGTSLMENLQLAVAVSHATDVLHQAGVTHGDLQSQNVLVNRTDEVIEVHLIDFDNFSAPKLPFPPCIGHILYMPPEIRQAMNESRFLLPDEFTDRFALGVLNHEMVMLKHPATGADDDQDAFEHAMASGRWLHDPINHDHSTPNTFGFPVEAMNLDLVRFFRRMMSCDPQQRPSSREWVETLYHALNNVLLCPACNELFMLQSAMYHCPLCKTDFPILSLRVQGYPPIPIVRETLRIGRKELGGSPSVSKQHALFRRHGPFVSMECMGSNGTWRRERSGWASLVDHTPIEINMGDRFRFADIEIEII